MSEIWIKMEESPHLWISSEGRFYREPYFTFLNGKPRKQGHKYIEKFNLSKKGYQRINVMGTVHQVHRLVAKYFLYADPGRPQVNHKNGLKTDNRMENLEWCTNQENRDHAVANGLHYSGPRTEATKALHRDRDLIASRLLAGDLQRAVAEEYGVRQQAISKLLRSKDPPNRAIS